MLGLKLVNNINPTFTADDLVIWTDLFDASTHFHADHLLSEVTHCLNNIKNVMNIHKVVQSAMKCEARKRAALQYGECALDHFAQNVLLCECSTLAIGDSALSKIIRGQLNRNAITGYYSYEMLAHLPGDMSYDFMAVL